MPNEFDKILREKLSGYKPEYHAGDWQKMEAMLPRDSRKPLLLLPLLLLLLGVIGLWSGTHENSHVADGSGTNAIDARNEHKLKETETAKPEERQGDTENRNTAPKHAEAGSFERNTSLAAGNAGLNVATEKKQQTAQRAENQKQETASAGSSTSRNSWSGMQEDKMDNGITDAHRVERTSKKKLYSAGLPLDNTLLAEAAEAGEVPPMSVFEGGQIPNGVINPETEISNPETKKRKKRVMTVAMGAGAGINLSFTDATRWTKPGYAFDLNEEMMFINRIGVALSQAYTVRNYDGGNYPCPLSGYAGCPNTYSSTVKSVDFGIDAKANLISKPKWNWYVKTGIISSVKLHEEFEYHYPVFDTIVRQPNLVPQTNFSGSGTNEMLFDGTSAGGLNSGIAQAPDLTISGNQRYHTTWHFSTGVDYKISPKVGLQFELGHSFTKPTVGEGNSRLHSLGLNGRVCYLFGK